MSSESVQVVNIYSDIYCSSILGSDSLENIANKKSIGKKSHVFLENTDTPEHCFSITKEAPQLYKIKHLGDFGLFFKIVTTKPTHILYNYYINVGNTWIYFKKETQHITIIVISELFNIDSVLTAKIGDNESIGNDSQCKICIKNDNYVKAVHTKIEFAEQYITIIDQGSQEGTWVQFKECECIQGIETFRASMNLFCVVNFGGSSKLVRDSEYFRTTEIIENAYYKLMCEMKHDNLHISCQTYKIAVMLTQNSTDAKSLLYKLKDTNINSTTKYDEILLDGYDENDIKLISLHYSDTNKMLDFIKVHNIEKYNHNYYT